jgi:hypothetical protein
MMSMKTDIICPNYDESLIRKTKIRRMSANYFIRDV